MRVMRQRRIPEKEERCKNYQMIITREMGTILPDTTMSSPVYIDARTAPITLHGFCESFRRVPAEVARATSEGVFQLSTISAGGRIRF